MKNLFFSLFAYNHYFFSAVLTLALVALCAGAYAAFLAFLWLPLPAKLLTVGALYMLFVRFADDPTARRFG